MENNGSMTWEEFCEDWKLQLLAGALFILSILLCSLVLVNFKNSEISFYDRLTASSIGVTLLISVSYFFGSLHQGWNSENKCCIKWATFVSALLSVILTIWLYKFITSDIEYKSNLKFAIAVYLAYVILDLFAYGVSKSENCGKIKSGLAIDVKRSFWQVDLPTLLAILLFAYVCFKHGPNISNSNELKEFITYIHSLNDNSLTEYLNNAIMSFNKKPIEAFAQGGLAFLMLGSSICFTLGFPKYVLLGINKWYKNDICPRKTKKVTK